MRIFSLLKQPWHHLHVVLTCDRYFAMFPHSVSRCSWRPVCTAEHVAASASPMMHAWTCHCPCRGGRTQLPGEVQVPPLSGACSHPLLLLLLPHQRHSQRVREAVGLVPLLLLQAVLVAPLRAEPQQEEEEEEQLRVGPVVPLPPAATAAVLAAQ